MDKIHQAYATQHYKICVFLADEYIKKYEQPAEAYLYKGRALICM